MAAGHGVRRGSALPKQFIELGGRPILQRTIECFVRAVPDIKVITVLPKEYVQGGRPFVRRTTSTIRSCWWRAGSPASIPSGTL